MRGELYHRGGAGVGLEDRVSMIPFAIHHVCCVHRIVREFLDEIIASAVHRCTEVEFMDQSVSDV